MTQGDGGEQTARSAAEWTTLGISVAVVLAVVGLISVLQVRSGDDAPTIVVEPVMAAAREEGGSHYLPVDVRNTGARTAQDVRVQAELDTGSGTPTTAEFTIAFLAGGDTMQGTFIFSEDPGQGTLTVEATSYLEP
jgi:uncharacterized protein (TIGR02588 family)